MDCTASMKVNNFIRNFANSLDIYFDKCPSCNGTGLTGVTTMSDGSGFSWSGGFCEECDGVGFIGWKGWSARKVGSFKAIVGAASSREGLMWGFINLHL